jgi:hypothetical protein
VPALSPSPPAPIELAASEHGGGPSTKPKCQGSQEPFPVFENLALPPVLVEIPAARSA